MDDLKYKYKAMRAIGCDWFTSAFVAVLNVVAGTPRGLVGAMHIIVEYDEDDL